MAQPRPPSPGEPPPLHDEAVGTPSWLPVVGLLVLVVGAGTLLWQSATRTPEAPEAPAVEEAHEAAHATAEELAVASPDEGTEEPSPPEDLSPAEDTALEEPPPETEAAEIVEEAAAPTRPR